MAIHHFCFPYFQCLKSFISTGLWHDICKTFRLCGEVGYVLIPGQRPREDVVPSLLLQSSLIALGQGKACLYCDSVTWLSKLYTLTEMVVLWLRSCQLVHPSLSDWDRFNCFHPLTQRSESVRWSWSALLYLAVKRVCILVCFTGFSQSSRCIFYTFQWQQMHSCLFC